MASGKPHWWKDVVVYQIWPASFKDSNDDGIGDIRGIISKLDYVKDLGADVIWLSPTYASPQKDMGYDISNYEDMDPQYGTLADMDELIREVHARGMKLLLDLVINHTSDQHAWFQESKRDKTNPKADWYIWQPPKYSAEGERLPPNNWASLFGGSAWTYAPERDEYYLHLFLDSQPDLNWEREETREAIYETSIRFWLRRGIDGFRVDTANLYSKVTTFPDAPVVSPNEPYQDGSASYLNGPRIHEFFQELRRRACDEFGDVPLVGECAGIALDDIPLFVGESRGELSMVFDFDLVVLDGNLVRPRHEASRHTLPELKRALDKVQRLSASRDAWATVFAENHDNARSVPRFTSADPQHRAAGAKLLALMLATLTGTLFIYQGQEIGMTNHPASWVPDELRDVWALDYWRDLSRAHPHDEELLGRARAGLQLLGRDNARTPVQWDATPHAGFTTGTPWMRVNDGYEGVNVAAELADPDGVLAFWRRMLRLRKQHKALFMHGAFEAVDMDDEYMFTYVKRAVDGTAALVLLNFSDEARKYTVPATLDGRAMSLLVETGRADDGMLGAWSGKAFLVPV